MQDKLPPAHAIDLDLDNRIAEGTLFQVLLVARYGIGDLLG